MRISASIVPKEEYRTSSFTQEASGEIQDFLSEEEDPKKDNMDEDAYTLLLSSNESEEKVKVAASATNNTYNKYHLGSFS